MRLIKAAIKQFHDYCRQNNIDLPDEASRCSFETDIPRLVGLAGSSAIVTAMRARCSFTMLTIPMAPVADAGAVGGKR